ncbi:hypothetical protein OQA88_751 [Cercophora sp. LCS_1]
MDKHSAKVSIDFLRRLMQSLRKHITLSVEDGILFMANVSSLELALEHMGTVLDDLGTFIDVYPSRHIPGDLAASVKSFETSLVGLETYLVDIQTKVIAKKVLKSDFNEVQRKLEIFCLAVQEGTMRLSVMYRGLETGNTILGGEPKSFEFDPIVADSIPYRRAKSRLSGASIPNSGVRSGKRFVFSEESLANLLPSSLDLPLQPEGLSEQDDVPDDANDEDEIPRGPFGDLKGNPVTERLVDGPAFTIPDSGYGTASRAGTRTDHQHPTLETVVDDIASVITDNLSLDLAQDARNIYVDRFVEQLLQALGQLSEPDLQRPGLIRMLPDLLRTFALRVSYAERTADGRAVGVFTRQNRHRIAEALQQALQPGNDGDAESKQSAVGEFSGDIGMSFEEKVLKWSVGSPDTREGLEPVNHDPGSPTFSSPSAVSDNLNEPGHEYNDEEAEDNPGAILNKTDAARIDFVINTSSFSWLLQAVKSRSQMDCSENTTLGLVNDVASTALSQYRGNRALRSQQAVVRMTWDPRLFTKQQGYDHVNSLFTAVTITGTAERAQLLPCRDYLDQMWPITGVAVLEAIVALVESKDPVSKQLFDGLQLSLQLVGEDLYASCVGLFDSIVEAIEVLAWIGSSLRESSDPDRIKFSTAKLVMDEKAVKGHSSVQFTLSFAEEQCLGPGVPGSPNGGCWLNGLLKNPVIAKGFPTRLRPKEVVGLEMPLGIMALLMDTTRLTLFNNRAFLKGFNAAIIPAVYEDSIMQWHFILNGDGERLRYEDERIGQSPKMAATEASARIQGARHFVGWISAAAYNIGSPLANYDIGWSSPDFVGPGCALEKLIISGDLGFMSLGAECSLGRKDKSPIIKRHTSYFESLGGLSQSYVVLYDIQDHRAWLSNGLHTLLHLVRTSLREDQKGDFSDECLLNQLGLEEEAATDTPSPRAAVKFFKNRRNLDQPLLPGLDDIHVEHTSIVGGQSTTTNHRKTTTVRLKDRIMQLMDVLWQLIDHQATLDVLTSSVQVRLPRNKLEGYCFMDVAARRAMTPRVVYLQAFNGAGKSWVDFVRAIRAVTLFGEGFGNLILPHLTTPGNTKQQSLCARWDSVPAGRDYLAVSGYDLDRILRQEGSASSNPLKLAPGVYWTPSSTAFKDCACGPGQTSNRLRVPNLLRRPCDKVQILLPETLARIPRLSSPPMTTIDPNSAFIFGKSELFPWKWPDIGDPKPEDPNDGASSDGDDGSLSNPSIASTRSPTSSGQSPATGSRTTTSPTTVASTTGSQSGGTDPTTIPSTSSGQVNTPAKPKLREFWKSLRKR